MQYNSDGTIRFDIGSAQRVVTATATKAMTAVLGACTGTGMYVFVVNITLCDSEPLSPSSIGISPISSGNRSSPWAGQ